MTTQLPETYLLLESFRENDIYLPEMDREALIRELFPNNFVSLVQRFSDISAAMYGIMLKNAAEICGINQIDRISRDTMYVLGKENAERNMNNIPGITSNLNGFFKVLLATVFTASPEYEIIAEELTEHMLKILIKGSDRYHRITSALGIEKHLTWPVIEPYLYGVAEGLNIECEICFLRSEINQDSSCYFEISVVFESYLAE